MRAGKLRFLVSVHRDVVVGSGVRGNPSHETVPVATGVPANITALSGRTLEIARQFCATATHEVTIRHLDGITAGMRVTRDERTYAVEYVNETDNRDREVRLLCTELTVGAT